MFSLLEWKIITAIDFILSADDSEAKGQPGSIFLLGEHEYSVAVVQLLAWVQSKDSEWDFNTFP